MASPVIDSPGSRRRRRLVLVGLAAVVIATAIGATAWQLSSRHTISRVTITPGSMRCDGKEVPLKIIRNELGDSPPTAAFAPHIDPAAECWLTVVVANDGPRSVHLDSLTFDAMMPGESGRFNLEAPRDDAERKPREVDESGDAIFDADETIAGGTWIELTYEIHYRNDGGTCPGVAETVGPFPAAHLSAAGTSANVTGSVLLAYRTVETEANRGNCGS